MRLFRTLLASCALAASLAAIAPEPAFAENFFERLFGVRREPPPPPPPAPVPAEAPPAAEGEGARAVVPAAPAAPRQPVVLKTPAEDNVYGQELKLNGLTGSLKIERTATGAVARVTLPGTKISQPTESCTVKLNAGGPVALNSVGKPDGLARIEAAAAECPLRFDVAEGGVFATSPSGNPACTFSAADCATTPVGMWGPPAAELIGRAGDFDTGRGIADKAVRDNFKVMTQRMKGQDLRPVVMEQAAFSSDREELCRTYAREGAHGFCHLRFTEARALGLATRLGANMTSVSASATPRAKRKPGSVDGMNPDTTGATAESLPADQ